MAKPEAVAGHLCVFVKVSLNTKPALPLGGAIIDAETGRAEEFGRVRRTRDRGSEATGLAFRFGRGRWPPNKSRIFDTLSRVGLRGWMIPPSRSLYLLNTQQQHLPGYEHIL